MYNQEESRDFKLNSFIDESDELRCDCGKKSALLVADSKSCIPKCRQCHEGK